MSVGATSLVTTTGRTFPPPRGFPRRRCVEDSPIEEPCSTIMMVVRVPELMRRSLERGGAASAVLDVASAVLDMWALEPPQTRNGVRQDASLPFAFVNLRYLA